MPEVPEGARADERRNSVMNKLQKIKLKKILLKMRDDTRAKIKHIEKENLGKSQRDASGDLSGYSFHMADVASDNFECDMSLELVENEQKLLYEIEEAIVHLRDKKFGRCQQCEKEIGMRRLGAVPYAQLCIACQEKEDKRPK